jgi:hypothetical protein
MEIENDSFLDYNAPQSTTNLRNILNNNSNNSISAGPSSSLIKKQSSTTSNIAQVVEPFEMS